MKKKLFLKRHAKSEGGAGAAHPKKKKKLSGQTGGGEKEVEGLGLFGCGGTDKPRESQCTPIRGVCGVRRDRDGRGLRKGDNLRAVMLAIGGGIG